MEYVYAALMLNETGEEINEENLTGVLDAAGVNVQESRVKALVAALEDLNIDQAVEEASAVPAAAPTGAGTETEAEPEAEEEEADEAESEEEQPEDEDEEASGEGLGELFG